MLPCSRNNREEKTSPLSPAWMTLWGCPESAHWLLQRVWILCLFPVSSDLGQTKLPPFALLSSIVNGDNDPCALIAPRGIVMFGPKCFWTSFMKGHWAPTAYTLSLKTYYVLILRRALLKGEDNSPRGKGVLLWGGFLLPKFLKDWRSWKFLHFSCSCCSVEASGSSM